LAQWAHDAAVVLLPAVTTQLATYPLLFWVRRLEIEAGRGGGPFACLTDVVRTRGWLGVYRGLGAQLLYANLLYGVNEVLQAGLGWVIRKTRLGKKLRPGVGKKEAWPVLK
jgi:hypothetical protein